MSHTEIKEHLAFPIPAAMGQGMGAEALHYALEGLKAFDEAAEQTKDDRVSIQRLEILPTDQHERTLLALERALKGHAWYDTTVKLIDDLRRIARQHGIDSEKFLRFWYIRFGNNPDMSYATTWAKRIQNLDPHKQVDNQSLSALDEAGFDISEFMED